MSKKYTIEELRKMKGKSDLERIRKTTEKDIMEQSMSDPDTPYLSEEELKEFTTPEERKRNDESRKNREE